MSLLRRAAEASPTSTSRDDREPRAVVWIVVALLVLGTAVRLYYAAACHLNPDEAMHWAASSARTWSGAYAASRNQAHPPLMTLATHAWLALGDSELMLRLPSVLLGVLSLYLAYRWIHLAAGWIAAVAGLAFLVGSPAMIAASSELRQMAWLLTFAFAALLAAERLARQLSVRAVAWLSICLCGAVLSHFSAAWIILVLGFYVPLRLWTAHASLPLWATWGAGQVLVAAVGFWSYFIHAARWAPALSRTAPKVAPQSGAARFGYIEPLLPSGGSDGVVTFAMPQLLNLWEYLCGHRAVAALILFAIAAASIRAVYDRSWRDGCWPFAAMLVSGFLVAMLAALLNLYPLGGSRHCAYLLPFAAGGVGLAASGLSRSWPRVAGAVLILLMPLWLLTTRPANDPAQLGRGAMRDALEFVDALPPEDVLLVDFQTSCLLRYYWRDRPFRRESRITGGLDDVRFGKRRVAASSWGVWVLDAKTLVPLTLRLEKATGGPRTHGLWLMSTAWPKRYLPQRLPRTWTTTLHQFGATWLLHVQSLTSPAS